MRIMQTHMCNRPFFYAHIAEGTLNVDVATDTAEFVAISADDATLHSGAIAIPSLLNHKGETDHPH